MKCIKCNSELFKIEIMGGCDSCVHNGAWDGEDYIYDADIIHNKMLTRDQTESENECELGNCWDCGCYLFACSSCGHETNLAAINEQRME